MRLFTFTETISQHSAGFSNLPWLPQLPDTTPLTVSPYQCVILSFQNRYQPDQCRLLLPLLAALLVQGPIIEAHVVDARRSDTTQHNS